MKTNCTYKYETLFGPVPSRRLGISLGVDLVPHKTCTLDCVYCECGSTNHLTVKRKEYVRVDQVKEELTNYLSSHPAIDHITFSGSGEPTLNDGIGDLLQFLNRDYPQYAVALLTNSTLLDQPIVRRQVMHADVVMASMDAVTPKPFRQVNRPHHALDLEAIINGLIAFRKMYLGQLMIEYFLVDGCNASLDELLVYKNRLTRIGADGVLLNTLDRPGTEAWVQPVEANRIKKISDFLEGAEIVKYETAQRKRRMQSQNLNIIERLVKTVKRRPCTATDVSQIIGLDIETVEALLDQLVASNILVMKQMKRGRFYMAT